VGKEVGSVEGLLVGKGVGFRNFVGFDVGMEVGVEVGLPDGTEEG
jgi:hypothetical protein